MPRTQGFEGIDEVINVDLARLYVVALIERLMAFETDRNASVLCDRIEAMLERVEPVELIDDGYTMESADIRPNDGIREDEVYGRIEKVESKGQPGMWRQVSKE